MVTTTKFVPPISMPKLEVTVPKKEILATRKIRIDLSKTKPKKPTHLVGKKQHKPQWFCHFCGRARHTRPNCFKLQACKQATKPIVSVPKTQDSITLIHELVKTLSLFANTRVNQQSHVSKSSNFRFASRKM